MRSKHHRLKWTTIFLAASLVGAVLALSAAVALVLSSASTRLRTYAAEFMVQDEKVAQSIDLTLSSGNASTDPPCSDNDLALLRTLLFQSPYLKDVGRIQGKVLLCSAVVGRTVHAVKTEVSDATQYQGRDIFYNVDLQVARGQVAEIIADWKTNVVVSPFIFNDFSHPPMLFAGAIVNRKQHKILQMYSSSSRNMPLDILLSDHLIRRDGTLYYPRCSVTRPDCVLIGLPLRSVWQSSMGLLVGAGAGGALLGIAFSIFAYIVDRSRRTLASQLRRAIKRKELSVVYQPIVDVCTGSTVSCEALVRWTDEDSRQVRPDIFIALAEEGSFIGDITIHVVELVLSEMADLLRAHPRFLVSVNLSAMDLMDARFLPWLEQALQDHGVSAASIGLELTERSTADRDVVVQAIHDLRKRGHVVYIDDFGTGYSSLSYLHELSVDVLKIDRAFTNTIGTDSVTASIVPQMLAMADVLRLGVVVEGVERQEQADYLAAFGRGIRAQGWLYGKGVPAQEFRERLLAEAPQENVEAAIAR